MNIFLKKILFFIIPLVLALMFVELILPPTVFTFRVWEAVSFKHKYLAGQFYPNVSYEMQEEGDLAHHTEYAVAKDVVWKTDGLGYRNDLFLPDPDILLIGDSNIVGSSLSQNETLASSLKKRTGRKVYSLAPANINSFIKLHNVGLMHAPETIIVLGIERNIVLLPDHDVKLENRMAKYSFNSFVSFFAVQIDKLKRRNSFSYLKARRKKHSPLGIQSKIEKSMFFIQGESAVVEATEEVLNKVVERIAGYKEYCDSIGSKFVFVPIPNKETIYWRYAGLEEQPGFISALDKKLRQRGIETVSTVELFNSLVAKSTMPYHLDDSHWNKNAVSAVAEELSYMTGLKSNTSPAMLFARLKSR